MPSRLALGTAQFGMSYGMTNRTGQVTAEEVARILADARRAGIDTLDTAMAYGESEQRLGEIGVTGWRVFTKLGDASRNNTVGWVRAAVAASLQRLGIDRLAGLLLHRPQLLTGTQGRDLWKGLTALQDEGVIAKIGVSVYHPDELTPLTEYPLDVVQAPFNVLDRRFATSGWLDRLHTAGTEVHTRSAYLQGLLLLRPETLPAAFEPWRPLWQRWHDWLSASGHSPMEACISFALAQPLIDRVVIGVENTIQLQQAVAATAVTINDFPDDLASTDLDLISPVRWRQA